MTTLKRLKTIAPADHSGRKGMLKSVKEGPITNGILLFLWDHLLAELSFHSLSLCLMRSQLQFQRGLGKSSGVVDAISYKNNDFSLLLAFKAERAGRQVVRVKPRNTSRRCANCGYVVKNLTLKVRWFLCSKCGWEADRDYNGSLNIFDVELGQPRRLVGREPLPLVIPYRKVIEGKVLSMKREALA